MIIFVNSQGSEKSAAQDQGALFERLVGELVDALGFQVTEFRAKVAGKEYDLTAEAKLGGRLLIGQAKATERSISAGVVSEFVGSLDVDDVPEDALGLFISVTDLTPEAKEYHRRLKRSKRERVVTIVGDQVFDRLCQIGYITRERVKQIASQVFRNRPGDTHLLVSDRGNYYVQLLVRPGEVRPKAFCIVDTRGLIVSDQDFGMELRQRRQELRELIFLSERGDFQSGLDAATGPVGPGPEGASWFEHKLPAPPRYFVGRNGQLDHFAAYLQSVLAGRTAIRLYQVLSPSGVGKSSFMLKSQNVSKGCVSVIQDARSFRSPIDLLSLLQEFLVAARQAVGVPLDVPSDTLAVLGKLPVVDQQLQARDILGVLFVDQFESLFLKPDLYEQSLDLMQRVSNDTRNIVFCLARRNDQPTTFDDRVGLDLQRLREISVVVELRDFSRQEAVELLSHLSDEIGQRIRPRLQKMALEFAASGFPWLCKRIGAHIRDAVTRKGLSQDELVQNGIRPEELFEEDLAELDVLDREFLRDLARFLPATLDDLSQKYEGKLLAAKLKLFQDTRLIRLIGRTYDTYNDVFKEYLKTGELPLPAKYVFRSSYSRARTALDTILAHRCQSVSDL